MVNLWACGISYAYGSQELDPCRALREDQDLGALQGVAAGFEGCALPMVKTLNANKYPFLVWLNPHTQRGIQSCL